MAPRKQPNKLLHLTYGAVAELVVNSCVNIDANASIDDPQWQVDVDTVQEVLESHIHPGIWDLITNAALMHAKSENYLLNDCTVLYAVLANKNTKKLKIAPICESINSWKFYLDNFNAQSEWPYLVDPDNVDYYCWHKIWVKLISKLVNLEEMDMRILNHLDFFEALGSTCPKLRILIHKSTSCHLVKMLENCKMLQIFRHTNQNMTFDDSSYLRLQGKKALETFPDLEELMVPNLTEVLETVEVNSPLKLRYFTQHSCSPMDITTMVRLCPNLQCINIDPETSGASSLIFETLANSSLKLTELILHNFVYDNSMECFLDKKGKYIERFDIMCFKTDLYKAVLHIGKVCTKLSKLRINDHRSLVDMDVMYENPQPGSMFKNLTSLECLKRSDYRITWLCVSQSQRLTSLQFDCTCYSDEELLMILSPEKLLNLKSICLFNGITSAILLHIYTSCPKLQVLSINGFFARDVLRCLIELQKEVKENNVDLKLWFPMY